MAETGGSWGAYLRAQLKARDMSQGKLAELLGIHRSTVNTWINKGAGPITVDTLLKIAEALGDDPTNTISAAAGVTPANAGGQRDPLVTRILEAPWTDAEKAMALERLYAARPKSDQADDAGSGERTSA